MIVGPADTVDTGVAVEVAFGGVGVHPRRIYSGAWVPHASMDASIASINSILYRMAIDRKFSIFKAKFVPGPVNQDPQPVRHCPREHQPQPLALQIETIRLQERKKLIDADTGRL